LRKFKSCGATDLIKMMFDNIH